MNSLDVLALFAQALPSPEVLTQWSPHVLMVSHLLLWDRSIRISRKVDEIRRSLNLRSTKRNEKKNDG